MSDGRRKAGTLTDEAVMNCDLERTVATGFAKDPRNKKSASLTRNI
jgi:hypothetical protein